MLKIILYAIISIAIFYLSIKITKKNNINMNTEQSKRHSAKTITHSKRHRTLCNLYNNQ